VSFIGKVATEILRRSTWITTSIVEKPRANISHQKNARRSTTIIIDEETDSETTMRNLSLRSPQKRRRFILDDEDEDASASDLGTSTKAAEETEDSLSQGADQVTESESKSEGEGYSA
jgi:hypothetical protein